MREKGKRIGFGFFARLPERKGEGGKKKGGREGEGKG